MGQVTISATRAGILAVSAAELLRSSDSCWSNDAAAAVGSFVEKLNDRDLKNLRDIALLSPHEHWQNVAERADDVMDRRSGK